MTRKICFLLLFSLATVAWAQDQSNSTSSSQPPSDLSSTTSAAPESTSTTEESTTSAPPEPTTISQPSTTSPPETTTTEPSTTTPPDTTTSRRTTTTSSPETTTHKRTTTTTTSSPETTTTRRTTTTPPPIAPTPPPFPKNIGNWSVIGASSPCIFLKGALQLNVNVTTSSNKTETISIDIPSGQDAHVDTSGSCESEEQSLRIQWWSPASTPDHSSHNNTVVIKFIKQADEQYALSSVIYYYGHGKHETTIDGPFFLTNLKHSYICNSNQHLQHEHQTSYMLTENLQFEAFRSDDEAKTSPEDFKFSTADECKADNRRSTGVVLGIAVGIGLLIVVVISLGIYLYKRCKRSGYQPLNNHGFS